MFSPKSRDKYGKTLTVFRNPERAETLPGAMVTAIVSAIVLLGVAGAMSIVMTLQAASEAKAALQNAANNIETSLKSDSNLATRILPGPDGKSVAFHFQPEDGTDQCRVATWQVNDSTLVRTLQVYAGTKGIGCNLDSTEITGSTKTMTSILKSDTTFQFFNDLNREIRMHGTTRVFADPNDACPLSQEADGKCVIDNEKTMTAWGSSVVGNVGLNFTLENDKGTVTRNIKQNSVSSLYQAAQQAGTAEAVETENIPQPGVPTIRNSGTPYINTDSTFEWSDNASDGAIPAGYTKQYLVRVNGADVAVQSENSISLNSGTERFTVQVVKLYTRASLTVSGTPGTLIVDPVPPTPSTPVLSAPVHSWVEDVMGVSWSAATCSPASIGATVTYELYANGERIYSGSARNRAYTPAPGVTNTTFRLVATCNVDSLSFSGEPVEKTTFHNAPIPSAPIWTSSTNSIAGQTVLLSWNAPAIQCPVGVLGYRVTDGNWAVNTSGNSSAMRPPVENASTTYNLTARCTWKGKVYEGPSASHTVEHRIPAPNFTSMNYPRATKTSIDDTISATATCQVGNPVYRVVNTTNGSRSLGLMSVDNYRINASVHRIAWKNAYNYKVEAYCSQGSRTSETTDSRNIPVELNSGTFTVVYNCPVAADAYLPFSGFRGQVKYSGKLNGTYQVSSLSDANTSPTITPGGLNTVIEYEGYFGDLRPSTSATAGQRDCVRQVSRWTDEPGKVQLYASSLFANMTNFTGTATPPNTLRSTSAMFNGATSFNQNISHWDVSNVTNFNSMFRNATSFNQNIGSWDTGSATTMNSMFYGASAFNQNIGNWNTSNVTNTSFMFREARAFNQNISRWDTSNVTTMSSMFHDAVSYNNPVNSLKTGNVTRMSYMFSGAASFHRPMSSWDTSKVVTMSHMFHNATSLSQSLSNWDVRNVTDMTNMFFNALNFNSSLAGWNTSSLTSMNGMFYRAVKFNQPVNHFNVSQVTDMGIANFNIVSNGDWTGSGGGGVFMGARAFNQPLSSWNVSNVTNFSGMFLGAENFNRSINTWNVAKGTDMSGMFYGASKFNQPLNNWRVNNVTDMSGMFHGGNIRLGSDSLVTYHADPPAFNRSISGWNVNKVTKYTWFGTKISSANKPAKFR